MSRKQAFWMLVWTVVCATAAVVALVIVGYVDRK